jgi:hypothetical protein
MMDFNGENSAENKSTHTLNAAREALSSLLRVKSKERYEIVIYLEGGNKSVWSVLWMEKRQESERNWRKRNSGIFLWESKLFDSKSVFILIFLLIVLDEGR